MGGATEDRPSPFLFGGAQGSSELVVVEKLAAYLGHHVLGRALELGRRLDNEGLVLGLGRLLEADEAGGGHRVDHVVAPVMGALLLAPGVVEGRIPDRDREGRGLGDRQVGQLLILSEVFAGRRPHPVGRPAEVHGVHVELENLPLRVPLLQFDGVERFQDLALDGQLVTHDVLLDDLLGDRRAAAAGRAGHVVPHGAHDGGEVDPLVLEVVAVLGCQHRVDEGVGYLPDGSRLRDPSGMQLGQLPSVLGVDPGDLGDLGEFRQVEQGGLGLGLRYPPLHETVEHRVGGVGAEEPEQADPCGEDQGDGDGQDERQRPPTGDLAPLDVVDGRFVHALTGRWMMPGASREPAGSFGRYPARPYRPLGLPRSGSKRSVRGMIRWVLFACRTAIPPTDHYYDAGSSASQDTRARVQSSGTPSPIDLERS